jgi:hypothetical protein
VVVRSTQRTSEWRTTLVLAAREGWLIVRHPLHLAGVAISVSGFVAIIIQDGSRTDYFELASMVVMYEAILTFFATHLCATRLTRSRAAEWSDAAATSRASRTAAMCLATLAPFGVACLLLAVLDPIIAARGGRFGNPVDSRLLASAIPVLGAGLLAVAVSRWLRFLGAGVVAMAAVIAGSVWADSHGHTMLQPLIDWESWEQTAANAAFMGLHHGSPGWHDAYLTGLTVLALCVALLAHRRWRYPALGVALAAGVLTLAAGWRLW